MLSYAVTSSDPVELLMAETYYDFLLIAHAISLPHASGGTAEIQILLRNWTDPEEDTFFSFKEVKFAFIYKQHSNSCAEAQ